MFFNCKSFDADLSKWNVSKALYWNDFIRFSLLENYPERMPALFEVGFT